MIADQLKLALTAETKAWKSCYSNHCNATYRVRMNETRTLINILTKQLSRSVKDLDDVRSMMMTLKELRKKEISIDMGITPIEVFHIFQTAMNIDLTLAMCQPMCLLEAVYSVITD